MSPLSLCLLHQDNTESTAVSSKYQLDGKATSEHPEVTCTLTVSVELHCDPCWSAARRSLSMRWRRITYPSCLAHNRLGPSTMAMLLGVILLMSLVWASFARNLIKYLDTKQKGRSITESVPALPCAWHSGSGTHYRPSPNWEPAHREGCSHFSCTLFKTDYWGLRRRKQVQYHHTNLTNF